MTIAVPIAELRKQQYDFCGTLYPYVNDWKRHPYTFLKARFYMEASAILVYFLQKTNVKPNTITLLYALCGVVGGVLLSVPARSAVLAGILVFFLKGILDWSDGHLARLTDRTSLTGHVLDCYGALVNSLGFWTGLSIYLAHISGNVLFLYLAPAYPLLVAANAVSFSDGMIAKMAVSRGVEKLGMRSGGQIPAVEVREVSQKPSGLLKRFANGFPDDRARTVDLICFLMLMELFTGIFVTWLIFLVFILKNIAVFVYSLHKVYLKEIAENTAASLRGY